MERGRDHSAVAGTRHGASDPCLDCTSFENVISISSSASGLCLEAPILGNGVPAGEGRRAS